MTHFTKLLLFFLSLFVLTNCQDKFDEYYERPDWLAAPIYQQLESRGNFKHFLAAIDKAGYKQTLSTAGYWTMFAPNDAAFEKYFQEQGIAGVEAMSPEQVRKIVNYALVYNAFTKDQLADFQSPAGWVQNNGFRRRTAYYTGVYTGTANGTPAQAKLIAANRNGGYFFGDNNNKHVPYFIDEYFTTKNLSAADYNYFFPNSNYTGFNVVNAAVIAPNIQAENGVIHEVDKVIEALPSMDEYLAGKAQYSVFRDLLEKYGVQSPLLVNQEVTDRNRVLTGSADPVYVKAYRPFLAFSPNNENFLKQNDNDAQMDSWSMFVPTNEVLTQYINNVLLEHYKEKDLSLINPQIIYDFINAHLWQTAVWPSKFAIPNFVGEPARFNPQSDVVDARILSNGMFYGTNKVQESDAFHSVFGKAYLDPKYNLMTRLLQRELRYALSNPNTKFALLLLSDEVLGNAGYKFDQVANAYLYNESPTQAQERLTRLLNMHVVLNRYGELNDLSGEGIVETYGGEFIKYKDGRFYGAGNEDSGDAAVVTATKTAANGLVYYQDQVIKFTESKPLGAYIQERGDAAGKPYFKFYEYLRRSSLYNTGNHEISGVASGVFYTAFIPSNAAMDAAVADGALPANPATTNGVEKFKIERFLQYHILNKKTVAANGAVSEGGSYESLYKTAEGGTTTLLVKVAAGPDTNRPIGKYSAMTVTDMRQRTANVILGDNSNVLANRALIHQIDSYLQYD
jgi:uncharacterized surface protein with fasciclin (FAS1) repeats